VISFNLTSHWCSFMCILTILLVSPIYTFPQEQGILYTLAELSGDLWSLGSLFALFFGVAWFGCYTSSVFSIWSVASFIYVKLEKIFLPVLFYDDCVLGFVVLLVYLIILFIFFFLIICLFFCKQTTMRTFKCIDYLFSIASAYILCIDLCSGLVYIGRNLFRHGAIDYSFTAIDA